GVARPRGFARAQPADLAPMRLVGPVGEAERPRVGPHRGQREFLAHAAAAVELHGALDHLQRHVGYGHLDLGDGLLGGLVADGVHHIGRVQHQEPRLVDLDARLGDALERDVVLGQALAERHAALRALAHELEGALGGPDLALAHSRFPNRRRLWERLHSSSRARSATPIWRMQWWMRPGPSRPWAISKPRPSPSRMLDAGTRTFSKSTSPWPWGASS